MSESMNDWIRARLVNPNTAAVMARIARQSDPEALLDQLAHEVETDPDVIRRLDAATRRRLADHLITDQAIRRAVEERRQQPPPPDAA